MAAAITLAVLALARPAPAFDPEATFARGTTIFGSGLLRSAVEPGIEGWFQYYLSPHEATAQGIKVAMRYHLIGFGPLVPYLEATAGAGARVALRNGLGRVEYGLSFPAHLERTHLEPEPGFQLRLGDRCCFVLFQVRAR